MDKINLGSAENSGNGDTGRSGGDKINENFKEIVAILTGDDLWDAANAETISLSELPTQDKSSIVASIKETFAKSNVIDDDAASNSLIKTYSISKIVSLINGGITPSSDFTATQVARLKELVYEDAVALLVRNLTILEKGVLTDVTFNWNVDPKDDTLVTADFDGTDISANLVGNQIFNIKDTTTKNLNTAFTRLGEPVIIDVATTSNFYVPQYEGKMTTDEPVATYAGLAVYGKTISASTNLTLEVALSNEHLFFICNSSTKTVKDNLTGFTLSSGEWASTTAFMIKKDFIITLADGTTETSTIYRTREKKTQTLNISLV